MEHYEKLMGAVHVAVVGRAVWEDTPAANRPDKFADAQFATLSADELCTTAGDVLIDEEESARAMEFIQSCPKGTARVVEKLTTEDPKWPRISCNAGLGVLQLRFCWACKRSELGIGSGTMMAQKRVEKHAGSKEHKAAVNRLVAVEHQAALCSAAFAKSNRARERGEDIGHKEHQKRLCAGKAIDAVSEATSTEQQQKLVSDFQAQQLQELASGGAAPLPAAAKAAPTIDPLHEPAPPKAPEPKAAPLEMSAVAFRLDGFTVRGQLAQAIGIAKMPDCAKSIKAEYTPQRNASQMTVRKSDDIPATCTVNTSGLILCMSAATEQLARQAIGAVARRIGDLEPDSVRVAAVGGGAHLGIEVPMGTLDSMVQNFGGLYDGELNPYWRGKLDGAAIHVFASGSVRVPSAPSREAAVAAYEQVRGAVFRLRNEALPDVPPIKWYA